MLNYALEKVEQHLFDIKKDVHVIAESLKKLAETYARGYTPDDIEM